MEKKKKKKGKLEFITKEQNTKINKNLISSPFL
jgi:hypothetical protein